MHGVQSCAFKRYALDNKCLRQQQDIRLQENGCCLRDMRLITSQYSSYEGDYDIHNGKSHEYKSNKLLSKFVYIAHIISFILVMRYIQY